MTLQSSPLFPLDFVCEATLPCTAKGTELQGFQALAITLKCHAMEIDVKKESLSSVQQLGVEMTVRFNLNVVNQIHLPVTTVEYGIHPVYFCSAHHIEMLLKAELPLVCSAFHMSGFTPSQEEALHGFRVSDYLDYMENLEAIYRPMLLKDMRTITVQNT
ncbi:hypothetical protein BTVI_118571 [Pitangus sulphuratus]|nr:hypothetical protein BTVI_118571 [Pitangus sulphuratus]